MDKALTTVFGVAQAQSQVVQMFQDLFQSELSQFTAGTAETGKNTENVTLIRLVKGLGSILAATLDSEMWTRQCVASTTN